MHEFNGLLKTCAMHSLIQFSSVVDCQTDRSDTGKRHVPEGELKTLILLSDQSSGRRLAACNCDVCTLSWGLSEVFSNHIPPLRNVEQKNIR